MLKDQVAKHIAATTNLPDNTVHRVLNAFEALTTQALREGEDVLLTGFVKFTSVQKEARVARNPQTGESVEVPPKRIVKIRPMATLKRDVAS